MNFKELFDREILNEQYVRKELKIFYELKLDLYKPKEATETHRQKFQLSNQLKCQLNKMSLNPNNL